ncbi:hypothetical protein ACFC1W_13330 [Microbacterium sp. NPDC056003]|uniref:hypothetical protein n=1 Tax=Microbacterium sp. NPDC056003 TaxID=3345676 RepID=UPI0035E33E49
MSDAESVRSTAGSFVDDPAQLGTPIAVKDAGGALTSWFVPILAGASVAGFVELLPDLTHRRTSWFPDAPAASSWLDPAIIRTRAATALTADEIAAEPTLSFDGSPDRLAWAVPVRGARGDGIVFVAGDVVWRSEDR